MKNINIVPSTSEERALLFMKTLINIAVNDDGSSKISKISPHSVLAGVAGGVGRIAGRAEKDIAIAISSLFPDLAFEEGLDQVGLNFGIGSRYTANSSSVYLRINATPGTLYEKDTHIFSSTSGIQFQLEQAQVTVGSVGFIYVKVNSLTQGLDTNVEPLSINRVSPAPNGHQAVINEYMAIGGRDIEDDKEYRERIKTNGNLLAKGTLAMLEQVFIKINNNVLRVIRKGNSVLGELKLGIITRNGANLSQSELDELLDKGKDYFSLLELRLNGSTYSGLILENIAYYPIDISYRLSKNDSYNIDDIRKRTQVRIAKYLDPRTFNPRKQKVEWDNLLTICKNDPGIDYIPDQYFYPRKDLTISTYSLPRLRSFLMLDLKGNVLVDQSGNLTPVNYPNVIDENYHKVVLKNIV